MTFVTLDELMDTDRLDRITVEARKVQFGRTVLTVVAAVLFGLGWVTAAALRLEEEHLEEQAQVELQGKLQLALSLLDSRVRPPSSPLPHHRRSRSREPLDRPGRLGAVDGTIAAATLLG